MASTWKSYGQTLPYFGLLGGVAVVVAMTRLLVAKPEVAPTVVELRTLTASAPAARWLDVTGGGLYLPDMIDEQRHDANDRVRTDAYYVPLIDAEEAARRREGGGGPPVTTAAAHVTIVKFDPSDYEAKYPITPETIRAAPAYQPVEITGLRDALPMFSSSVGRYVCERLHVPEDAVTVVHAGARPLTRAAAVAWIVVAVLAMAGSACWILYRWFGDAPRATPGPSESR